MIYFDISAYDLASPCRTEEGKWIFGNSFIQPYKHKALEAFGISDSTSHLFVIREKNAYSDEDNKPFFRETSHEAFLQEKENIKNWSLHYVSIYIDPGKHVHIHTGAWGISPIYVIAEKERLIGHWHPKKLYPFTDFSKINQSQLLHFLGTGNKILSKETLFSQIHRLTERTKTTWDRKTIKIKYPDPIPPPCIVKDLKKDADVLSAFKDILFCSMERYISDDAPSICSDLSGGLDSAILAYLASLLSDEQVTTYGMIIMGDARNAQIDRRKILMDAFKTRDITIDTARHLPLSEKSLRIQNKMVVPWEGYLYEPNFALYRKDKDLLDDRILFNGFGGDELFIPYLEEKLLAHETNTQGRIRKLPKHPFFTKKINPLHVNKVDMAPMPPALYTSFESGTISSPMYMENNVWPVSPFCTPELITFVRSLPYAWRADRRLQRDFLTSIGFTKQVTQPKSVELFDDVLIAGLRGFLPRAAACMKDSYLADLGLVEPTPFLQEMEKFLHNPAKSPFLLMDFYNVIHMEMSFSSIAEQNAIHA